VRLQFIAIFLLVVATVLGAFVFYSTHATESAATGSDSTSANLMKLPCPENADAVADASAVKVPEPEPILASLQTPCGTTTTNQTVCAGTPSQATVPKTISSQSCTTLTCGSLTEQFVTNTTVENHVWYERKDCPGPDCTKICKYARTFYTKDEKEYKYESIGFGRPFRCRDPLVIQDSDLPPSCSYLAGNGGIGIYTQIDSTTGKVCSWAGLPGPNGMCYTQGSFSCAAQTNAPTSCTSSPPTTPPSFKYPCQLDFQAMLMAKGYCWFV